MTAAILTWKPKMTFPHVMQVTHPHPAFKGISSPKDCPVFARDYDCRGEYINATYQPLGKQVQCFSMLLSITVHCCSLPLPSPAVGRCRTLQPATPKVLNLTKRACMSAAIPKPPDPKSHQEPSPVPQHRDKTGDAGHPAMAMPMQPWHRIPSFKARGFRWTRGFTACTYRHVC